jgi:hypothetical protein
MTKTNLCSIATLTIGPIVLLGSLDALSLGGADPNHIKIESAGAP